MPESDYFNKFPLRQSALRSGIFWPYLDLIYSSKVISCDAAQIHTLLNDSYEAIIHTVRGRIKANHLSYWTTASSWKKREDESKISREVMRLAATEVRSYLPIPPSRSKEFWTRWKIEHIRELARTGHATNEIIPPALERSNRLLDQLLLELNDSSPVTTPTCDSISLRVLFANDSKIELSSPLYLGDMSFGALSGIPNIAIARAAEKTGVIAGTGEGGLLTEVEDCTRITVQWASARFGVDSSTLARGQGVVIKIGQGAKPGIGGHLPGVKVTESISQTRRIPVGKDAISPAPHHDIYSIEDLGQRILSLREVSRKPVLVKVGATNYIPYIASGIARMGASGIIIDGAGAGTGAAPSVIKDNVGIPIELAVSSVDRALKREGLRDKFTVIAAGRVSTPEDSLKLIALGADITSLGTAALISLGCIMVHKCHLGYCPAVLTNKITPHQPKVLSLEHSIHWLSNLVLGWNEEMRIMLEKIGLNDIKELRGRRDLLRHSSSLNHETLEILGFNPIQAAGGSDERGNGLEGINAFANQDQGQDLQDKIWTARRVTMLRELAGTTGKTPGEAEISSMGTTAPPHVEEPVRISDYLVSDGAQVTRPSVDPYREEIETVTFLFGAKLRMSAPFFFTHLPRLSLRDDIISIFAKIATSMGLILDLKGTVKDSSLDILENRYSDSLISEHSEVRPSACKIVSFPLDRLLSNFLDDPVPKQLKHFQREGKLLLLRCASSEDAISNAFRFLQSFGGLFSGVLLDEDNSSLPLEVSVSLLDRELKKQGKRNKVSLLAESNNVRGSDDVFKLLALGADAVGLGMAALLAIGFEKGTNFVFDTAKSSERLENFVLAMQKDIKLLAGAAGISSVSSSLVGNRELLRSINLDPQIRKRVDVKPAGAA